MSSKITDKDIAELAISTIYTYDEIFKDSIFFSKVGNLKKYVNEYKHCISISSIAILGDVEEIIEKGYLNDLEKLNELL